MSLLQRSEDYSEIEGTVRAWAREVCTTVEGRVFFGEPRAGATFPFVIVRLTNEFPDRPCTRAIVEFEVLEALVEDGGSKSRAGVAARSLFTAADNLIRYDDGTVVLKGAMVLDYRWVPSASTGRPRYQVVVEFLAIPA